MDGKPLPVIGKRRVHFYTSCERPGAMVPHVADPFISPTELLPAPSGDLHVSEGCRNNYVHRLRCRLRQRTADRWYYPSGKHSGLAGTRPGALGFALDPRSVGRLLTGISHWPSRVTIVSISTSASVSWQGLPERSLCLMYNDQHGALRMRRAVSLCGLRLSKHAIVTLSVDLRWPSVPHPIAIFQCTQGWLMLADLA